MEKDYSGKYQDLRAFITDNKLQEKFAKENDIDVKDWEDYASGEMGTDEEVIEELTGKDYKLFYDEDNDEFIVTKKKTDKIDYKIILSNKKYDKEVLNSIGDSGIHSEYEPRFAVIVDNKVVGGSTYKIDEDNVYNFDLGIIKKYEGYGIANELVDKIIEDAQKLKADEVKAYVVNNVLFNYLGKRKFNIEKSSGEKYAWLPISNKYSKGGIIAWLNQKVF